MFINYLRVIRSSQTSTMASHLPPRVISSSGRAKHDSSPLQILLQLGFTKHRALKALAATGNRSVQLASDWLLTHVNDSFLDTDEPREYIFYASPTGSLLAQLMEFWDKSKELGGWNGAHNFPPHVTLVSFFKAPDETSLQLAKAVKQVVESVGEPPSCALKLEPYISHNFMGLFVSEEHADYLKKIAVQYVKQVSSALGITMDTYEHLNALGTCFPWCTVPQEKPIKSVKLEPHVKSLHITLAYHFKESAFKDLKELVDDLRPVDSSSWELRLYSRDPRFNTHHVHKVTQSYEPKAVDELELVIGDYIYIEEKEIESSPDGWVQGTSWLTGVTGYLPAVYTCRTAESDAWTLHRGISLGYNNRSKEDNPESERPTTPSTMATLNEEQNRSLTDFGFERSEECYEEWKNFWKTDRDQVSQGLQVTLTQFAYAAEKQLEMAARPAPAPSTSESAKETTGTQAPNATCPKVDSQETKSPEIKACETKSTHTKSPSPDNISENASDPAKMDSNRRWIFSMRHGERVDLTYSEWVPYCFDANGVYNRLDLNMPISLPKRTGGKESYALDTPLTRVGRLQAQLVGEGLRLAGITIRHIYASAALRCIETAQEFLNGLQADSSVKIRVEPGLFEYKAWHLKGLAPFMTPDELQKAGFNIDLGYKPYVDLDISTSGEPLEEFYSRNAKVMQSAYKDTEAEGGNLIFVGHAATLDLMAISLKRLDENSTDQSYQINKQLVRVPYCAIAAMLDKPVRLVAPPVPPSMNSSNGRFDWTILLDL